MFSSTCNKTAKETEESTMIQAYQHNASVKNGKLQRRFINENEMCL